MNKEDELFVTLRYNVRITDGIINVFFDYHIGLAAFLKEKDYLVYIFSEKEPVRLGIIIESVNLLSTDSVHYKQVLEDILEYERRARHLFKT